MQTYIKIPLILVLIQLVEKSSCKPKENSTNSNCDSVDSITSKGFCCPSQTDCFVAITIRRSKVVINCSNKIVNHSLYVPIYDLSAYDDFNIQNCNFYSSFSEILRTMNVTNLSSLRFFSNDVNKHDNLVRKEAFKDLSSLKKLEIVQVKIQISEDFLAYTKNLTYLSLWKVNLNKGFISFDYVPLLTTLILERNNINFLPNKTFKQLSRLEFLDLSWNYLKELSMHMLIGLESIRVLDFKRNVISFIEENTFSSLIHLTEINLAYNQLTKLPIKLFYYNTKLNSLWLNDNPLVTIADKLFWNCANLNILILNNLNKLAYLPDHLFTSNNSLQRLELVDSNLNQFLSTKTLFSNLSKLTYLDIGFNKFVKIDMNLFSNISNQFKLDLSKTDLVEYPDTSKVNVSNLDLRFNFITHVKAIQLFSSAKEIRLDNNRISKIDFRLVRNIPYQRRDKPIEVTIKHNRIACNCSNYDLLLFINKKCFGSLTDALQFKGITSICANGIPFTQIKNMDCPVRPYCPLGCTCTFNPDENEMTINCASKNLTQMPHNNFFTSLTNVTWLKLYLVDEFRSEFPNCMKFDVFINLDLSGNVIEVVDYVPPNLKYLDLSRNKIRALSPNIVYQLRESTTLLKAILHDNPWDCGCGSFEIGQFIIFKGANSSEVYCENKETPLSNIRYPCTISPYLIATITACLGFLLCLTVAFAIYYKFQTNIKIFLFNNDFCLYWISEEDIDPDKTYDVFISFSHEDEKFVLNHLLPGLEATSKPYKVCIHTRDWVPGELIVDQIVRSVCESRRTLVVLSNSFVNSIWGKMEFRTAHTEAVKEGKTRVIVILYGQVDINLLDDTLKSYIQTNTYVQWGDKYFWQKLRYALPHSSLSFIDANRKLELFSVQAQINNKNHVQELPNFFRIAKQPSVIMDPLALTKHQSLPKIN